MEQVTITIPFSRFDDFRMNECKGDKKEHLRWGQALHQYMEFNKVTSPANKEWCDVLYNADFERAYQMVTSVLDWEN